jgi:hypothetical protein
VSAVLLAELKHRKHAFLCVQHMHTPQPTEQGHTRAVRPQGVICVAGGGTKNKSQQAESRGNEEASKGAGREEQEHQQQVERGAYQSQNTTQETPRRCRGGCLGSTAKMRTPISHQSTVLLHVQDRSGALYTSLETLEVTLHDPHMRVSVF